MIVALHGFTGTPAMWGPIGLSGPTLLGHGEDARAGGTETFSDEVARLTEQLPGESVHLVGYSLGARLALAIGLKAPQRIARLTLIGGTPGLGTKALIAARVAWDADWSRRLREHGIEAFVDRWQALPLWESQGHLAASVQANLRNQRLAHDPEQLARAMDALGTGSMPPMWDLLERLDLPVQILAGQLDSKYVEIGKQMCARLPKARLRSIPRAGHNPVLEQPQAVLDVINESP